MSQLGVRTPAVARITDIQAFRSNLMRFSPPLLVREELGHNTGNPISLVKSIEDARRIPLEQYENPIAVEFVDVCSADGLVRKFRYMAMGDLGVAHSLQISRNWEVRGGTRDVTGEAAREEEVRYTSHGDRNHDHFQKVRRGLDLDFVAFDYSYDHQGRVVVWEINVLPGLDLPDEPEIAHVLPTYERAMAATAKMYLQYAGLAIPPLLEQKVSLPKPLPATRRRAG